MIPLSAAGLLRIAAATATILALLLAMALLFLVRRYRALRRRHDDMVREKEAMFSFIHDVAEVFAESDIVDLHSLLQRVLYYALRTTRASAGAIYLVEPGGQELRARAIAGVFPPIAERTDLDLDGAPSRSQYIEQLVRAQVVHRGVGLIGEIADFGGPALITDAERDPRVPHYDVDLLRVRSLLAVPMRFRGHIMGVLVTVNRVDGSPFTESDLSRLQALADQASVSAHYSILHSDLDAKKRMDHDLSIARHVQRMLLPRKVPDISSIEMAAFNLPALEIGGDYYDFLRLDDRHLGIAIADVSGKGIGGALVMSVYRSVLRAHASDGASPAAVLREVHRALRDDLYEDMFVTALYLVLDTVTGEMRVARAGHEAPILRHAADNSLSRIESEGLAIGLADDSVFDEALSEVTVNLQPGDTVVLYTDGITEAMNAQGEEWGLERLIEALRQAPPGDANAILNHVRTAVMTFVGDTPPYDDMTMVLLRMKPGATPSPVLDASSSGEPAAQTT